MNPPFLLQRQRGIALPVMMIVLVIMLISGAYLLKASNSTTLTSANLAYQSVLTRANDRALMEGSEWLSSSWTANKAALDADNAASGYVASFDTTQNVRSANFWTGSRHFTDDQGNSIEVVIHRLCSQALAWNDPVNQCMQTTPNVMALGSTVAMGSSLSSNALQLAGNPQLHYIITARINGTRGGNVISQLAVLIGV